MNKKQEKAYSSFVNIQAKEFEYKNVNKKVHIFYKDIILKTIEINIDELKIVSNRFVFNQFFYTVLFKYMESSYKHLLERRKEVSLDNALYTIINRLKRNGFIHFSSSYFPKSLRQISINPNPFYLLNANFKDLDIFSNNYDKFIFYESDELIKMYIYLRFYNKYIFTKRILKNIKIKDILSISEDKSILILNYKLYTFSKNKNTFYKTIILDEFISKLFFIFKKKMENSNLLLFKDIDFYEEQLNEYKNIVFPNTSMHMIRYANKNYYLFKQNTFINTLRTRNITSVQLSIKEIDTLYPNIVSKEQLIQEKKYIESIFKIIELKSTIDENSKSYDDFELYQTFSMDILLSHKTNNPPKKLISKLIEEITARTNHSIKTTQKLIYSYILYELNKLLLNKIKLSTFKSYIYMLNRHLFTQVGNLENIQDYEIDRIMERFKNNHYSKSTIDTVNRSFKRFFLFIKKDNKILIDIPALLYPKSIIFIDEIDQIFLMIDEKNNADSYKRKTKKIKFKLMQDKIIILLGFYSGLRKNELRSRLLKDLYFDREKFFITVDNEGMNNLGLKLKTKAAKRRVELLIDDSNHFNMIKEWLEIRETLNIGSRYLFLKFTDYKIYSKVINEEIFDDMNKIIKIATRRYATFHSLRHSFATYRVKNILENKNLSPYLFIELSMQMGHQTPDTTVNKYVHFDLLQILDVNL